MKRIVILVHRDDPHLSELSYVVQPIVSAWKESGYDVSIVSGPQATADGDIALLHVNLTRVPDDHLEFINRFPVVLNGRVVDISKRTVSRNLVQPGDGYEGPVIVKSNLNSGGRRESRAHAAASPTNKMMRELRKSLPWAYRTEFKASDYRIFPTVDEVPEPVWTNSYLVVEKFLAEMHDGLYARRTWIFFGDQELSSVGYAACPIIGRQDIVREEPAEVPEDLRQIRRDLGFDYGKFDYVIVGGQAVLFDANRTPTRGQRPPEEEQERGRLLAAGLQSFL